MKKTPDKLLRIKILFINNRFKATGNSALFKNILSSVISQREYKMKIGALPLSVRFFCLLLADAADPFDMVLLSRRSGVILGRRRGKSARSQQVDNWLMPITKKPAR